jgi:hypothetical protein
MTHRLAWGHRSYHQGSRTLGYRVYRGNPQSLVHMRLQYRSVGSGFEHRDGGQVCDGLLGL